MDAVTEMVPVRLPVCVPLIDPDRVGEPVAKGVAPVDRDAVGLSVAVTEVLGVVVTEAVCDVVPVSVGLRLPVRLCVPVTVRVTLAVTVGVRLGVIVCDVVPDCVFV